MGWFFGRGTPGADDGMYGSGLTRRQWFIVARLFEEIAWRDSLSVDHRDQLKPLIDRVPRKLRDAMSVRYLERYVMEGDKACLDLAAHALAPGYDNPWLLISKSL